MPKSGIFLLQDDYLYCIDRRYKFILRKLCKNSTMITGWNPDIDGVLSEANMRKKLEAMGYTVHRYIYPPGTYFPDHSHAVDKIDGVLSGRFKMTMQGHELVLGPGDCLHVPRGVVHSAEVIGNEPVVSLDAVKQ